LLLLQLVLSFEEKAEAKLARVACGDSDVFKRALMSCVAAYNETQLRSRDKRESILRGLKVVCEDYVPSSTEEAENILIFLVTAFKDLLEVQDTDYLRFIIRIVGVIAETSILIREILHRKGVFTNLMDAIIAHTTPDFATGTCPSHSIVDIALKSQLLILLFVKLKKVMVSLSLRLSDLNEEQYSSMIADNIPRFEESESKLRKGRNLISSLVSNGGFTADDESFFHSSKMMSELVDLCALDDLTSCSHLLKVFVIFGSDEILRKLLLRENAVNFTNLFNAALGCPENSVEDSLVKFWLVKRTCDNIWLRNFLFRRDGVILGILAIMRTISSLDAGRSLEVLVNFCDDSFFYDMSLTTPQVIQRFGEIFQSDEFTDSARENSEEILLIFADGLDKTSVQVADLTPSGIHDELATSFIESTILFRLLTTLSINDSTSQWRAKGSNMLRILVRNKLIQEVFVEEPLSILLCAVRNASDSFDDRSSMATELISITEVIAVNPATHERLFQMGVVEDIIKFINEVVLTHSDVVSDDTRVVHVLRCLNVLDVISTACNKSCSLLKDMGIETVLQSFMDLKMKSVSDMISKVLKKVNSC
jgi:hypothetical protein